MELNEERKRLLMGYEAVIRRSALTGLPFMLKGSFLTRQFFPNEVERIPVDLDWIYLEHLNNQSEAENVFNEWATKFSEIAANDEVDFRSFKENQFWRCIDYAMEEDFPTVNTDLLCYIDEKELELGLDVSFNLPVIPSVNPLTYHPLFGDSFELKYSVPIGTQIGWKIHQSLVRPRFKDFFDLIYLLVHPSFDEAQRSLMFIGLAKEMRAGSVPFNRLVTFLNFDFEKLFPEIQAREDWSIWRWKDEIQNYSRYAVFDRAEEITNAHHLPEKLSDFFLLLQESMVEAKLTKESMQLYIPDWDEKPPKSNGFLDFFKSKS